MRLNSETPQEQPITYHLCAPAYKSHSHLVMLPTALSLWVSHVWVAVAPFEWILRVPEGGGHRYELFTVLPHSVQVSLKAWFDELFYTDPNSANLSRHISHVGYLKPGNNRKAKAASGVCMKQQLYHHGRVQIDSDTSACSKCKRVDAISVQIIVAGMDKDDKPDYKLCFFPLNDEVVDDAVWKTKAFWTSK